MFDVLHDLQTYSMLPHSGWQDFTICAALVGIARVNEPISASAHLKLLHFDSAESSKRLVHMQIKECSKLTKTRTAESSALVDSSFVCTLAQFQHRSIQCTFLNINSRKYRNHEAQLSHHPGQRLHCLHLGKFPTQINTFLWLDKLFQENRGISSKIELKITATRLHLGTSPILLLISLYWLWKPRKQTRRFLNMNKWQNRAQKGMTRSQMLCGKLSLICQQKSDAP